MLTRPYAVHATVDEGPDTVCIGFQEVSQLLRQRKRANLQSDYAVHHHSNRCASRSAWHFGGRKLCNRPLATQKYDQLV